MTPDGGGDLTRQQLLVEAWKKTVEVQQHFNDIEIRIRSFAISFLGVVLGAAAVAHQQAASSLLAAALAFVGLIGWVGFYMMDGLWYHRLLYGAVKHGQAVEEVLEHAVASKAFHLTHAISEYSPYLLFGRINLRTTAKLKLFYVGGAVIFGLMIATFLLVPTPISRQTPPTSVNITAGQETRRTCATRAHPKGTPDSTSARHPKPPCGTSRCSP